MFFSIILPIYNVEKYLEECIDSVLKQRFTDYELILVDDGSPDNSGKICDEYALKDNRIRVVHKVNGGLSDARNVGLQHARGKYIIYIDSDDYVISDDFLSCVYNSAIKSDSDIIIYKFQQFTDGETKLSPCAYSLTEASNIENTDDLLQNLVQKDAFYASAWTKSIKRDFLINSGVLFEKGLLGEDNEWYLHLLSSGDYKISAIDKPFIAYRQRAGSISKTTKIKNLTDYIYVLEKWSNGIENANISNTRKEALFSAMAKYYANLLICYLRVNDPEKKKYKKQVKDLSFLLNYSKSKRPVLIKKVYSLVGFEGTVMLLKILDKVKG